MGMNNSRTMLFTSEEIKRENLKQLLKEVSSALEERGYNPINQIVGYLISGDSGYISSYKDARKKITSLDRAKILEAMVKNYIK